VVRLSGMIQPSNPPRSCRHDLCGEREVRGQLSPHGPPAPPIVALAGWGDGHLPDLLPARHAMVIKSRGLPPDQSNCPDGLEDANRRIADLGSDAVPRNQGYRVPSNPVLIS